MKSKENIFAIIMTGIICTFMTGIICMLLCHVSSNTHSTFSLEKNDPRSYQHGVDFLKRSDDKYILIWASSGSALEPTGADDDGEWSHDIYYSIIDSHLPSINPVEIISAPGAQEPASSDITTDGHIMITMEDSWQARQNLTQTYGVYDEAMLPIKDYQQVVFDGGHSGHVASVGHHFVVFYSDGWVDGGGVDNLGSGDNVLLSVLDSNGNVLHEHDVSVGENARDWWPMIAGSDSHALLVWQRFVDEQTHAQLFYKIYNPVTDEWIKHTTEIAGAVEYYTYDAQYIEGIDRFLISGSYKSGDGFTFLLLPDGSIVAQNTILPSIIREAQPAIRQVDDNVMVAYPTQPNGVVVLSITESNITIEKHIPVDYEWSYVGTDGIFLDDDTVYFVSLSPTGPKELQIDIT